MPIMYAISARVHSESNGWRATRELPTFYLHPCVQGIVSSAHAESIARRMLRDTGATSFDIGVSAVNVD